MEYADVDSDRRTRIDAGQGDDTRISYKLLGLGSQGPNNGDRMRPGGRATPEGTLVGQLSRSGAAASKYYILNGLGSVVALTSNRGALVKRCTYEPYGQEIGVDAADTNPWRFGSGYFDRQTGLLKFGTRYYDPTTAHWTQKDHVRGQLRDPMSLSGCAGAFTAPTAASATPRHNPPSRAS